MRGTRNVPTPARVVRAVSEHRDRILASVREATASAQAPAVPRNYARTLPDQEPVRELFIDRLVDYKAEVHEVTSTALPSTIGKVLGQHKITSLVLDEAIDPDWLTTVPGRVLRDRTGARLSAAELNGVNAVLTTSRVSVAQTGTIILDGGPGQGRRAISLVPDLHLCLVAADSLVGTLPEALEKIPDPTRPLTWISGPSATSDIELQRVEGVHGPRTLVVFIVD